VAARARHNEGSVLMVKCKYREPQFRGQHGQGVVPKGSDKVGVLLEVSYGLAVGENPAEAAALLCRCGLLHPLHLNDKPHSWEKNRMGGSVHLVEFLKPAYWLKTLDYKS